MSDRTQYIARRIAELRLGAARWKDEARAAEAQAKEHAGRIAEMHRDRAIECRAQAEWNELQIKGLEASK